MNCVNRKKAAPLPGIVHLGPGAFSRAHLSIYTEDAILNSGGDWGIVAVSLQSSKTRDDLASQQYAYTALQLNPGESTARQVEVMGDLLVAAENPEAVLELMANPVIKIVSLTVTEKGYCLAPSTGALDRQHPDIMHDLSSSQPTSAPGYLVRALERRMNAGHPPFTILSCDNLPENGHIIRHLVLEMAGHINAGLATWIDEFGRFPSTMVDRITPATTPADRENIKTLTGLTDAAPVVHEPFSQWVIEDDFVNNARPDWASAGAELVGDVRPYELMKLRMLNGTHSTLAYLGYLARFETIADTVADDTFRAFTQKLWQNEIIPSLTAPPGVSLPEYAGELMTRYSNPGVRHLTWQIAMDGSQKLPQRILDTLDNRLGQNAEAPGLTLAVAAWMRYVAGIDETGDSIDVRDPLAGKFAAMAKHSQSPEEWVARLLALRDIFPDRLARQLSGPVTQTYRELVARGARAMVRDIAGDTRS